MGRDVSRSIQREPGILRPPLSPTRRTIPSLIPPPRYTLFLIIHILDLTTYFYTLHTYPPFCLIIRIDYLSAGSVGRLRPHCLDPGGPECMAVFTPSCHSFKKFYEHRSWTPTCLYYLVGDEQDGASPIYIQGAELGCFSSMDIISYLYNSLTPIFKGLVGST